MKLNEQQLEARALTGHKNRGRRAEVHKPYFTVIPSGTKVYIHKYSSEDHAYFVEYSEGEDMKANWVLADEIQFIDKEFSGYKIEKLGVRTERKDKYGNSLVIEVQTNKRDLQFSQALISLLNLKNDRTNIGFARDPDTKQYYVFAATEGEGYELDNNNRITSTADCRELELLFNTTTFNIIPEPIIDYNHPDLVLYSIKPEYNYNNPGNKKQRRSTTSADLAEAMTTTNKYNPYSNTVTQAKKQISGIYGNGTNPGFFFKEPLFIDPSPTKAPETDGILYED